jgi:hypothetical protein
MLVAAPGRGLPKPGRASEDKVSGGRIAMLKTIGALIAVCVVCQPSYADESGKGVRHAHRSAAWPDHHIIEVAINPPNSREFIINGTRFAPKPNSCAGWEAGDRVNLISGDWHGWCWSATFENLTRRQTCDMWCGYAAGLHP